jgi:hypothetical protein
MSQREELRPAIKRVLELLENVRRGGEGYSALCPAHGDTNNSLSVTETDDGHVLIKCFAGCETSDVIAELGLEWKDLFATAGGNGQYLIGLTVEDYAKAKGLPESFLRQMDTTQVHINGVPVVRMPYLDSTGVPLSVRMRMSLDGDIKFRWKTGSEPALYGLWLDWQRKSRYIIVCEGESDCHTLWFHKFPALGLPGATTWREEWSTYFDPYERIYVVIEPDKGGESVLRWLSNSKIRERARLITIPGAKDPSALYLSDRTGFKESWKAVMKAAIPWSEREIAENRARREAAWNKCKALAQEPDVLERFAQDLGRRGVAGEKRIAETIFLAMISRFLSRPTSLVVAGPSSAGKSFTVQQTLEFFPASSYYALTGMSERALAYSCEPLSHRFLVLYEGAALNG